MPATERTRLLRSHPLVPIEEEGADHIWLVLAVGFLSGVFWSWVGWMICKAIGG